MLIEYICTHIYSIHTYIYINHTVCSVKSDFGIPSRIDVRSVSHNRSPEEPHEQTLSLTEQSGMFWPPPAPRHELTAQKLLFYQKKETQLFHSGRDLSIRTLKRWTDRNITNMWLRQNCVHIQFSWNLRFICICKLLFFIQAVRFYRNPWTACFPYAKNSPTTAKSFLTCFD